MMIMIKRALLILAVIVVLIARHFAQKAVTPETAPEEPLRILSINKKGKTVTLSKGVGSELPGSYSLIFSNDTGHSRIGEIISETPVSVTRNVLHCFRGQLRVGVSARVTGWWYDEPEDLGYPVVRIDVPSKLGANPAWLVKPKNASKKLLTIHVHGRGAKKQETLRGVKVFAESDLSSLVIGYRNDQDCPRSDDQKYGLGMTEANDLIDAIEYGQTLGYTKFALFGWSMGATICLQALKFLQKTNTELFKKVRFLILESPAVDWPEILLHHAKLSKLPKIVAKISLWMIANSPNFIGLKQAIPVTEMTSEFFANNFKTKTLLLVSKADTFVPCQGALRFAELAEKEVQLFCYKSGDHVKIWNANKEQWAEKIRSFIQEQI